jgi:hypothetical protein
MCTDFGVLLAQYMHDHPINYLCLAIIFGVEDNGFAELGVQQ